MANLILIFSSVKKKSITFFFFLFFTSPTLLSTNNSKKGIIISNNKLPFHYSKVTFNNSNALELLNSFDKSNLIYGGRIGLALKSNVISVNLSPNIGYRFFSTFAVGGGLNFQYSSQTSNTIRYTLGYVGPQFFARYYLFQNFSVFTSPELNLRFGSERDLTTNIRVAIQNKLVPSLVTGLAYSYNRGFGFTGFIGYDLLQNNLSPYKGVVFGVNVGFF